MGMFVGEDGGSGVMTPAETEGINIRMRHYELDSEIRMLRKTLAGIEKFCNCDMVDTHEYANGYNFALDCVLDIIKRGG